jgi:hypothetical protein
MQPVGNGLEGDVGYACGQGKSGGGPRCGVSGLDEAGTAGAFLNGVAVSGRTAWAVGTIGCGCAPGGTLILRWNGRAWKLVPAPSPGANAGLSGVASAAGRAWAVGYTGSKTLILRWVGATWK